MPFPSSPYLFRKMSAEIENAKRSNMCRTYWRKYSLRVYVLITSNMDFSKKMEAIPFLRLKPPQIDLVSLVTYLL